MRDYKFRQVEPSYRRRKPNLVKPVFLVFTLALALALAIAFAPSWLGWTYSLGEQGRDPNIIPLTLPPRPGTAVESK
jgi:hypothetical protein